MKFVKVFHNPEAGEGAHSKEKLIEKIKAAGFDCSYSSTKKVTVEKRIPEKTDIILIAGGDGTVKQLANYLINRKILAKRFKIALVPSGTANNIARTLGIEGSAEEIINRWKDSNIKKFDVAKVDGIKKEQFFLEGLGFGVFPRLMQEMKSRKIKSSNPEKELYVALKTLLSIVNNYKSRPCNIRIDEMEYKGDFLMVEIMNIKSIGPNLNIAVEAKPDDGVLDVILVTESQRRELALYVENRLTYGKEETFFYTALKAKKVSVRWGGKLLHTDDELLSVEKFTRIDIEAIPHVLHFLI